MSNPTEPSPSPPLPHWWNSALVALGVMGISLFFRLPLLGESLWVDELHTAWVVADSPQVIPERAAMGNQSPLYFWGVWTWLQASGMHEWSLRFPSLLAGVFAVGFVTFLAHRWTKDALLAIGIGFIASLDTDWIFFATEARTYALVQAVAIGQVIVAWHACQHDRISAWLGLIVLSLINFYLHYSTLLFTGGVGFAMLMLATNHQARKHLLFAGVVLLLGIGVSVPHLVAIFERRANWAQFISVTSTNEWNRWGTVFALLIPASIALAITWSRKPTIPQSQKRRLFFLSLVVLLPLATAWLTTATGVAALFFGRYLFSAEACVLLLLASMVAMLPGKWLARGMLALAVLLSVIWRIHSPWQAMRGENWPQIVAAASNRINTMDSPPEIVIAAGLIETDILLTNEAEDRPWNEFACLPIESIYRLPGLANKRFGLTYTNAGQPTPRLQAESDDHATVILLVRGRKTKADQVARRLQAAFSDRAYQIETPQPQAYGVQWRVLTPQASPQ